MQLDKYVLLWPKLWINSKLIIDFTDVGTFDFDSGDGFGASDSADYQTGDGYGDTHWSDEGDGFSPGAFRHTGDGRGGGQGDQALWHEEEHDYA